MSQPERFAYRSRVLRDTRLSHGAKVLALLLDDEARGEKSVSLTQVSMAKLLGTKERACRAIIAELQEFCYLTARQTRGAAVYDFVRQFSAGPERQFSAYQTGSFLPVYLINQETTREEPLTPQSGELFANALKPKNRREAGTNPREIGQSPRDLGTNPRAQHAGDMCRSCRGKGKVLIPAIGWSQCAPCFGTGVTGGRKTEVAS